MVSFRCGSKRLSDSPYKFGIHLYPVAYPHAANCGHPFRRDLAGPKLRGRAVGMFCSDPTTNFKQMLAVEAASLPLQGRSGKPSFNPFPPLGWNTTAHVAHRLRLAGLREIRQSAPGDAEGQ